MKHLQTSTNEDYWLIQIEQDSWLHQVFKMNQVLTWSFFCTLYTVLYSPFPYLDMTVWQKYVYLFHIYDDCATEVFDVVSTNIGMCCVLTISLTCVRSRRVLEVPVDCYSRTIMNFDIDNVFFICVYKFKYDGECIKQLR